ALDKLGFRHLFGQSPVEPVQPNVAFDIASLVLYGCQALPIRLKILLDRLFSVLQREEVLQVLHGFGWTHEDYARGYILQEPHGSVLDRWNICSPEEEPLVLQQFLRFGETRAITQQLLLAQQDIKPPPSTSPPGLMNLSITSPSSLCLPPPPPPPPPIPASSAPPISFCHSAMAAAVASAGPLAAASLVASSLPGLISSVTTPGSKSPSAMVTDFMSGGGSSEFGSDEDDDDEENSHSALNLSRDGACIKPRQRHGHIRKATTPMKRQWGSGTELPLNLGTQLINPTTGKKRVQCNVCLKTFCDKGALKIHFSAVHLREMHKCTVEGCNMMFSSRRSRNRHSANPNPKLHSPHLRRNEERGENGSPEKDDECGTLVKRVKLSESDLDEITSNLDSNEDSLSVVDTHSLKEENGTECAVFTSKNVRKRKNQNPTRCAIPSILGHNDLLSDEDSSSDVVFAAATPEENATDIQQCIPVEQQQHQSQQQQKSPQSQCLHQSDVDVAPVSSNTVTGDKEIVDVDMEEDVPDAEPAEGNNQMDEVRDEVNEKEKSEVKLEGQERIEETDRDDSSEIKTSLTPLIPADKLKKEKSQLERTEGSSITSNGPDSPSEDNSQNMFFHDSGGFIGNLDVPIDKDNPRRCTACGKIFQNHFGVKTHFQNVHLKLMHKCTVEGCNAAFPSKRSRDRHSANLNLHRKLLSTSSSDKSGGGLFLDKSPFSSLAGSPSLHTEQMLINGERIPPPHPSLLLPPLGSLASFPGLNNFTSHLSSPAAVLSASVNGTTSLSERKGRSSGSNSPSSPSSPPADRVVISPNSVPGSAQLSLVYSVEEDMPMPDHEGFLPCTFCRKSLADTAALKEHYEQLHLGEMYRCTVPGCDKVFSSRSKRNLHSDNEALHKA
ncbi:hypothetical protein L798_06347, partial [Zootermopsis nevadensis]